MFKENPLQPAHFMPSVAARGYGAAVGRELDVDQLVSARAITERLGYRNVQVVHFWWRTDATFPPPVYALEGQRGARLWYWPEVEAWARASGRLDASGRPRPGRGGVRPAGERSTE